MHKWITDRLPTLSDAINGCVWVDVDGDQHLWRFDTIELGRPWMTPPKPDAYVKLKRWTVHWMQKQKCWGLHSNGQCVDLLHSLDTLLPSHEQAAERIAEIYEEMIP